MATNWWEEDIDQDYQWAQQPMKNILPQVTGASTANTSALSAGNGQGIVDPYASGATASGTNFQSANAAVPSLDLTGGMYGGKEAGLGGGGGGAYTDIVNTYVPTPTFQQPEWQAQGFRSQGEMDAHYKDKAIADRAAAAPRHESGMSLAAAQDFEKQGYTWGGTAQGWQYTAGQEINEGTGVVAPPTTTTPASDVNIGSILGLGPGSDYAGSVGQGGVAGEYLKPAAGGGPRPIGDVGVGEIGETDPYGPPDPLPFSAYAEGGGKHVPTTGQPVHSPQGPMGGMSDVKTAVDEGKSPIANLQNYYEMQPGMGHKGDTWWKAANELLNVMYTIDPATAGKSEYDNLQAQVTNPLQVPAGYSVTTDPNTGRVDVYWDPDRAEVGPPQTKTVIGADGKTQEQTTTQKMIERMPMAEENMMVAAVQEYQALKNRAVYMIDQHTQNAFKMQMSDVDAKKVTVQHANKLAVLENEQKFQQGIMSGVFADGTISLDKQQLQAELTGFMDDQGTPTLRMQQLMQDLTGKFGGQETIDYQRFQQELEESAARLTGYMGTGEDPVKTLVREQFESSQKEAKSLMLAQAGRILLNKSEAEEMGLTFPEGQTGKFVFDTLEKQQLELTERIKQYEMSGVMQVPKMENGKVLPGEFEPIETLKSKELHFMNLRQMFVEASDDAQRITQLGDSVWKVTPVTNGVGEVTGYEARDTEKKRAISAAEAAVKAAEIKSGVYKKRVGDIVDPVTGERKDVFERYTTAQDVADIQAGATKFAATEAAGARMSAAGRAGQATEYSALQGFLSAQESAGATVQAAMTAKEASDYRADEAFNTAVKQYEIAANVQTLKNTFQKEGLGQQMSLLDKRISQEFQNANIQIEKQRLAIVSDLALQKSLTELRIDREEADRGERLTREEKINQVNREFDKNLQEARLTKEEKFILDKITQEGTNAENLALKQGIQDRLLVAERGIEERETQEAAFKQQTEQARLDRIQQTEEIATRIRAESAARGEQISHEDSMARAKYEQELTLQQRGAGQSLDEIRERIRAEANAQGRQISFQQAEALAQRELAERMAETEQGAELQRLTAQIRNEARMQGRQLTFEQAQGQAMRDMQIQMQQTGGAQALEQAAQQIAAQSAAQGRQLSHEQAMEMARQQQQTAMQQTGGAQQMAQIGATGEQQMAQLGVAGQQQMSQLAAQIEAEATAQGRQISSQEAMAEAQRQLQTQMQGTAGTQQLEQIQAQASAQQQTYAAQLESQRTMAAMEREALQIQPGEGVGTATTGPRGVANTYVQTLNGALNNAMQGGDYTQVQNALGSMLPPSPSGIVWDRASGAFQQREGFEGREMAFETQQWIAAVTPAFKARDRAEQAVNHAVQLQQEAQNQITIRRTAEQDFSDAMLTGDIDTAEEAITRQRMAETAAIAVKSKMDHLQMLFALLQNPVQLGMAAKHGLLGQIESALGFTLNNVPVGSAGAGVPTVNEWQTMDTENQAFSIASFVEQGGTPNEFMRMISGSAPAQMQTVQYGVL